MQIIHKCRLPCMTWMVTEPAYNCFQITSFLSANRSTGQKMSCHWEFPVWLEEVEGGNKEVPSRAGEEGKGRGGGSTLPLPFNWAKESYPLDSHSATIFILHCILTFTKSERTAPGNIRYLGAYQGTARIMYSQLSPFFPLSFPDSHPHVEFSVSTQN